MDIIYENKELFLFIILAWTLPWKAVGLWKAARRGDMVWFIIILLTNTLAILDILYVYIWSNRPKKLINN